MHQKDLADNQISRTAFRSGFYYVQHLAFHLYGRFLYTEGFYQDRFKGGKSRFYKFIDALGIFAAGKGSLVNHVIIHDVDYHLLHIVYIFEGMLCGIVSYPPGRRKDDDGRVTSKRIEKTKRR